MNWDEFSMWRPEARLRATAKAKPRNLPGFKLVSRDLAKAEEAAARAPALRVLVQEKCKHPVEQQTLLERCSRDDFGDFTNYWYNTLVCGVCGLVVDQWEDVK